MPRLATPPKPHARKRVPLSCDTFFKIICRVLLIGIKSILAHEEPFEMEDPFQTYEEEVERLLKRLSRQPRNSSAAGKTGKSATEETSKNKTSTSESGIKFKDYLESSVKRALRREVDRI